MKRVLASLLVCLVCVTGCKSALSQKELLDQAVIKHDVAGVAGFAMQGDVEAIKALGEFKGYPDAVGYLTKILETGNPYSRKIAAQALIHHLEDEDARVAVAELLQHATTPIRFGMIQGLERTEDVDKETRGAFLKIALNDLNPSIRMEAAIALRKIGDMSAGDVVYGLLGEDYVVVRRKAVQEMQYYPTAKYAPWLKALMEDPDGTVRKYAAMALENLPEGAAATPVRKVPAPAALTDAPVARVAPDALLNEVRDMVPGPVRKTNFLFVIGVSDYDDLPDVPYSRKSATLFAEAVQRGVGVPSGNVYALYDRQATGTRIHSKFTDLLNRVTPDSVVYFYYSGHGIPSKDGESSFLLPVDASMGVFEDERMELHRLLSSLAARHPRRIVAVIDSCFSGKVSVDQLLYEGVAPAMIVQPRIQTLDADVTLILAAREDEFSNAYKEKGHRLFSYYFIKALTSGKRSVTEIAGYVQEGVVRKSGELGRSYAQHPQFRGNLGGRF